MNHLYFWPEKRSTLTVNKHGYLTGLAGLLCFIMLVQMQVTPAFGAANPATVSKWLQLPDQTPEGIDIRMDLGPQGFERRRLGDDFECTQTGLITCVRFWGSWAGDKKENDPMWKGTITNVNMRIYDDVPAGADPVFPFSHPDNLLWEMDFDSTSFTESLYFELCPIVPAGNCFGEGFWDPSGTPNDPAYAPNVDDRIWLYTVNIDPAVAFLQEGTTAVPLVYWLVLNVDVMDPGTGVTHRFGWKTSSDQWNDTAVRDLNGVNWAAMYYPPGFINPSKIDLPFDLAFEIITEPFNPPDLEACCYEDAVGTIICDDLTVADCIAVNGTPLGTGTDCVTANLQGWCDPPPPTGACCLPNGNCVVTTAAVCVAHNGVYQGDGTDCTAINICPKCIPPDVPCANGESSIASSYLAGSIDNFAPAPDPATPDAALTNYITNCTAPPGYALQFDELPGVGGVSANSWFGHTFTGLPPSIVSATLEVRARATALGGGGGLAWNDTIGFIDTISGCTRTDLWINRFSNLPEASGTWNAGQTATFCLDLDALPKVGGGTTSVISDLASGRLSIWAQDDTGIDYLLLNIRVCPCKYPIEIVIPVGENDTFNPDADINPATPSAELVSNISPPTKGLDDNTDNARFIHTFGGLPAGIVGGTLEFRLRAHNGLAINDTINLEFLNPGFRWGLRIKDLIPTPPTPGADPWSPPKDRTFVLNLANLPPSSSGETSVIGDMTDGDLDVYFQDDTEVDYMILRLKVCCDDKIPGDNDGDGDVDLVDFSIQAEFHGTVGP
jgi:hypothetical protein